MFPRCVGHYEQIHELPGESDAMTAIVETENVWFAYGSEVVLEDVSLTIDEGRFLGLIGPNGSGKTTLLRLMLGLEEPDRGRVRLFGEDASSFEDGKRIGYVSQRATDRSAAMPVTVEEVVTMGRYAHRGRSRLRSEDRAIVGEALHRVGIADLASRRVDRLSGGQRQRAFIARALASEADFLALDEPTVGVDASSRDDFYAMLHELHDDGLTILLIEHDLDVITTHVDTVACINRRLHFHGDSVEFLDSDALVETYGEHQGIIHHHHP